MTWPQARYLASQATPHQDVFFNMWRLRWFAHALVTAAARLFDANIFTPERGTLAFSDAMLVEGYVAAPLVWAGVRPVLVHNLVLLGAIVLSARSDVRAGALPDRQPRRRGHRGRDLRVRALPLRATSCTWSCSGRCGCRWRSSRCIGRFDTGAWKYGVATGVCVALQMLSSIYYGIFLVTLLPVGALLLVPRRSCAPTARVRGARGGRRGGDAGERAVRAAVHARRTPASATGRSTRRPSVRCPRVELSRGNAGQLAVRRTVGRERRRERRLFPGFIPLVLAMVGLLLRVPGRRPIVYLLLLVAAFEMSLGLRGYSSAFMYEHVPLYRGLRALARLGIFVVMFLAVLAGYGYASLVSERSRVVRSAVAAVLVNRPSRRIPHGDPAGGVPERRAAGLPLPGHAATRNRRGVPRAPARRSSGIRRRIRLHVDVPLVSAGEWLQRDVSAVIPRAPRSTERLPGTGRHRATAARRGPVCDRSRLSLSAP